MKVWQDSSDEVEWISAWTVTGALRLFEPNCPGEVCRTIFPAIIGNVKLVFGGQPELVKFGSVFTALSTQRGLTSAGQEFTYLITL